jgi:hypothetical protein
MYSLGFFIERCYSATGRADFSFGTVQGIIELIDDILFITFRATDSKADWLNHFRCNSLSVSQAHAKVRVHFGWLSDYYGAAFRLYKIATPEMITAAKRVVFVGHSYGGALAALASYFFGIDYPSKEISLVTFNAPRAGNGAFVNELEQRIPECRTWHFIYGSDIISKAPPYLLGYRAYKNRVLINPRPWLFAWVDSARVIAKWIKAALKREPINFFEAVLAKDHMLPAFDEVRSLEVEA